jgi:hypothetical protein
MTPKEVSKDNPCIHCGKPDWCYKLGDLSVCKRGNIADGWYQTEKADIDGSPYLATIDSREEFKSSLKQEKEGRSHVGSKKIRPAQKREWVYGDTEGNPLVKSVRDDFGEIRVINGKEKAKDIKQQFWNGTSWQHSGKDLDNGDRVALYRYKEVREAIDKGLTIFLVEGEQCADLLWGMGLAATTNVGGSGKWRTRYSEQLNGASIVICPDNDIAGIKHAEKLSKEFPSAKWIYPSSPSFDWDNPPESNGSDVFDWIEELQKEGLSNEKICDRILGAIEPQRISKPSPDPAQTQDKPPKKTAADILLTIAKGATYFHTSDKVAYADIWIEGNRHTYKVGSKAFKLWLQGQYYESKGKGIGSQTLQDTLGTLEAIAVFKGETRDVHLRVAEAQDKIYLDLGTPDWKAVEIDASGWRLISDPPVRFWRPDSLLPLPYPTERGSLDELRELLNVDGKAWTLIVSFILFSYHPKHHKPILILHGEQGSGKTTVAEFLKSLIDPGKAGLLPAISDAHRMAIAASRRWVVAYDNLSGINPEQSDALCRISTGSGFSTRTLFSNDEETAFEFTRPQIITGIDSLATRGDLLQRSLMVSLPSITPDRRKTREALETQLNEARPRILGALLTALSQTLKALPDTNPKELPRMADFGRFAIAAETALGLKQGDFVGAFDDNREEAHEIVLESSPVAQAILRLMDNRTVWQGTASELLTDLEPLTDEKTVRSKYWPGNARALGKALTRLAPDLRELGIDVTLERTNSSRKIVLERLAKKTSQTSLMSQPLLDKGFSSDVSVTRESSVTRETSLMSPNVTINVTDETLSLQGIEGLGDNSDVCDMKNTTFSNQGVFQESEGEEEGYDPVWDD